jgi:hypothetical protein
LGDFISKDLFGFDFFYASSLGGFTNSLLDLWTSNVSSDHSKSASTSDNLSLESWSFLFEIFEFVALESLLGLFEVFLFILKNSELDDLSSVDLFLKRRSLNLEVLESVDVFRPVFASTLFDVSLDSNAAFKDSFVHDDLFENSSSGSNNLFGFDKSSADFDSVGE